MRLDEGQVLQLQVRVAERLRPGTLRTLELGDVAMGLTAPGQGSRAVLEGWTAKDGRLPVNRSGGLKAKGHPIGATGVSMHVITAMQLTGQAGDMQLPKADIGGVFNMGGAAVANYVSILEPVR